MQEAVSHYINHAPNPNLATMMPCMARGQVRVGFVAKWDIAEGEELLWNYAVRDPDLPWLQKRVPQQQKVKKMKHVAETKDKEETQKEKEMGKKEMEMLKKEKNERTDRPQQRYRRPCPVCKANVLRLANHLPAGPQRLIYRQTPRPAGGG